MLLALDLSPRTLLPVDDSARRGLAAGYRTRWPALSGAQWWPALGDGACALIGTGCGGPRAALTVGTSAAVRVLVGESERAARRPGLFAYLLDPDRVVLGAARSNAGNLVDWLGRVLRLEGDLVAEVAARPPGGHGLEAVPDLAGERSPDWPLAASGSVAGLHPDTTALDLAHALVEAAACGLADAIDSLEAARPGGETLALVGSGRALASPAWRRLVADTSGRAVTPSRVEEASARGAAVTALAGLGWLEPDPGAELDGEPVLPDPARAAEFARLRATGRGSR